MSNETSKSIAFDPVMQPFVDFWSDFMSQANETTREFLDEFDDRLERKDLAASMVRRRQQKHGCLHAQPGISAVVKQNTEAAMKFKRQSDDLANGDCTQREYSNGR